MKNILVLATTFPKWKNDSEPGFVYDLSNLLAKKGHNIKVLVPHHPKAKESEELDNLKIIRYPYFYPKKLQKLCYNGGIIPNMKKIHLAKLQLPFLFLSQLINTRRVIKNNKIDLIHAHWILPQGLIAYIIKKIYKVPYVVTSHAGDIFPLKNKFLKKIASISVSNAKHATANSIATKEAIQKICKKKIEVIPMGVNLTQFSPKKKDLKIKQKLKIKKHMILFVGRLVEKKGLKYLIRAMPLILKENKDSKLIIIGDGPLKENLINLSKRFNLEKSIKFLGKMSNQETSKYYATADLFVGPSIVTKQGDTEGLGIVFLESLASGTTVVGSNVGGIPDIINKKTGILTKEKNYKDLATKVNYILKNKKLRDKLAIEGRKHVSTKFSWDYVTKKFNNLIS